MWTPKHSKRCMKSRPTRLFRITPYRDIPDNSLKRSKAVVLRLNMLTEEGDAMYFVKESSVNFD